MKEKTKNISTTQRALVWGLVWGILIGSFFVIMLFTIFELAGASVFIKEHTMFSLLGIFLLSLIIITLTPVIAKTTFKYFNGVLIGIENRND
jgi:Na+-transporting NADH:ubiquinone oxidoreductase subunit NqrB